MTRLTPKLHSLMTLVSPKSSKCNISIGNGASPDGWAIWGVVMSTRWWLLVDHCVLRNWDRILVRAAVKGLISRAGMVSICPLLWQRDVKLQQIISNGPIAFKFYTEVKYLKLHQKNCQWLDYHPNCIRWWHLYPQNLWNSISPWIIVRLL